MPAPDKNDLFAQYQILEDLGDFPSYSLFKVKAPNGTIKLWKKVDLQFNAASIETRLLPVIEKVHHNHLNAVSNSFLFQDKGLLFVESEFPVKTLRHRLEELKSTAGVSGNGIPISELFTYIAQVADAIDFLNTAQHQYQGKRIAIYHRALSPDSLHLFEEKGKIVCKLGDFGLAKPIIESNDAARHSLGLTNYDYAPPEFDEGLTTNTSDQYSLATTYVELRTGRLPFSGTLLQKLQAQLNGTPDLSLLEPNERPVVARALSREPHARFPSCKDFVKNLQMALGGVVSVPIFTNNSSPNRGATSAEPAVAGGGGGSLFGSGNSGWALSAKPVGKSGGSLFNVGNKGPINTPAKAEGFTMQPVAPTPAVVPALPKAAAKQNKEEPKSERKIELKPEPKSEKIEPKPVKPEKKANKPSPKDTPARVPTPVQSEGWKLETASIPDSPNINDSVSENWTPGKVTAGKSNPSVNLSQAASVAVPTPPPPPTPPPAQKESMSLKARETLELIKKKQSAVAPSTPVPLAMDKQLPGAKLLNSGSHPVIRLPPKPGSRPAGIVGETPPPPRPANVPSPRRASTDHLGMPLQPRGQQAVPAGAVPRRASPTPQLTPPRRGSGGGQQVQESLRDSVTPAGGGATSWITMLMVMIAAFCVGMLLIAYFSRK